jgi:hypothetical protein
MTSGILYQAWAHRAPWLTEMPNGRTRQALLAGSSSSALESSPVFPTPPATNTVPLGNSVAVCDARGILRSAADDQVLLDGP